MAAAQPLTIDQLWAFERVAGLAASPDGARAVCSVTRASMDDNRSNTQLWLLSTTGAAPRQLTSCGDKDGQPAWSPSGDRVAFIAKRETQGRKDDTPQIYVISADGGEARRASTFAPGIEAFKWMPDGKRIVFAAWVWPELKGSAAQAKRHKSFTGRKESGYATSEGQYRYFDHHHPMGRVAHLLLLDIASGRITDLFEGQPFELPRDAPNADCFDISPDGRCIAFAFDPAPNKLSSNRLAIGELKLAGRSITIVAQDVAWDFAAPCYSHDGQSIAAIAAHVGKTHTALGQLAIITRGGGWKTLGAKWDHDVNGPLRWSADGQSIYFTAEQRGRCHLWLHELKPASFGIVAEGGWVQTFDIAGTAGDQVIVTAADSINHPVRVHAHRGDGKPLRLERFNDELLAKVKLGTAEEASITGALGDPVQLWLVYPPGFDKKKKYPVTHVIHGGPYAAAGDSFAYRWNSHLLASRGHVVAMVNYHGSSGFGLAFRDSIMGRLGLLELQDIEAATDWLLQQRWADRKRFFATGGSYGGYLVAWMNGHVKPGRSRAYVCHAGVFDRVATWSADSYTHRPMDLGASYWDDMAKVQAQSPATFAATMNTPTLVTHGALDYRVPDHNGLAYYNTLKARGVDARLLWFPDENHWVLKPRNSRQWYGEFFAWLHKHGGA